jgi:acetyl esterase/lipase
MIKRELNAFSDEMRGNIEFFKIARENGGLRNIANFFTKLNDRQKTLLGLSKTGDTGVSFSPDNLGGVEVELVTPDNLLGGEIVFYIHGGGFTYGNTEISRPFAAQMAKKLGLRVYTISYRLAPQFPFPAGVDDCFAVYQSLLDKYSAQKFAFVGESAGANFSIATSLKARAAGLPLPTSMTLYSLPGDFTGVHSHKDNRNTDYAMDLGDDADTVLSNVYCPGQSIDNPLISVNLADFSGFPPLKITADKGELLFDDSDLLAAKADKAGIEVDYQIWEDTFHAFPAYPTAAKDTPEGEQVVMETADFIREHF